MYLYVMFMDFSICVISSCITMKCYPSFSLMILCIGNVPLSFHKSGAGLILDTKIMWHKYDLKSHFSLILRLVESIKWNSTEKKRQKNKDFISSFAIFSMSGLKQLIHLHISPFAWLYRLSRHTKIKVKPCLS